MLAINEWLDTSLKRLDLQLEKLDSEGNLQIYQSSQKDISYWDVVGFSSLNIPNSSEYEWEDVEQQFINSIRKRLTETQRNVEPYLVFLIEESNVFNFIDLIFKVERDEYICRKFVLPINDNKLSEGVFRLPFTPLPLDKVRGNLPPTAYKVLKQFGIKSELAQLIVKQRYGKNDVQKLWNMLSQSSYEPMTTFKDESLSETERTIIKPNSVKLKSVGVKGFRPYGEEKYFNLDYDLVVIAGPNGLGKTSFFDAVDFAVTGGVRRLDKPKKDIKSIPNLHRPDECSVELEFKVYDKEICRLHKIKRTLNRKEKLYLDYEIQRDRRTALKTITQTNSPETVDRLVKLFRASHLVNQFEAELTHSLWTNSSLSRETVGRMLSTEDYVQAKDRCIDIEKEINKKIDEEDKEAKKIKFEFDKICCRIEELIDFESNSQVLEAKNVVDVLGKSESLIKELVKLNFVSNYEGNITQQVLKEYSVSLSGKLALLNKKFETLQSMKATVIKRNNRQELLNRNLEIRKEAQEKHDKEKKELDHLVLKQFEKDTKLNITKRQIVELRISLEKHIEYLKLMQNIDELNDKNKLINKCIEKSSSQLEIIQNDILCLRQKFNLQNIEAIAVGEKLEGLEKNIASLGLIKQSNFQIIEATQIISANIPNIAKLNLAIENLSQNLFDLQQEHEVCNSEVEKAEIEVSQLQSNLDQIRLLMQNMKEYVTNNQCPLCGYDHSSREHLLDSIDSRLGEIPSNFKNTFLKLNKLKEKTVYLSGKINDCKLKIEVSRIEKLSLETQLNKAKKYLLNLKSCAPGHEDLLADSNLLQKVNELLEINQQEKEMLLLSKGSLEKAIESVKESVNTLEAQKSILEDVLKAEKKKLLEIENELQIFKYKIIDMGFDLLQPVEKMQTSITKINLNLAVLIAEEKSLFEELNIINRAVEDKRIAHEKVKQRLSQINSTIAEIEELISEVQFDLRGSELSENCTLEDVEQLILHKDLLIKKLNSIHEGLISAEISLDIAQRNLQIRQLEQEKAKKEQDLNKLHNRLTEDQNILLLIKECKGLLMQEHNKALSGYCEATKPLASTIQRRLRPVYGFGNIDLQPNEEGEIQVSIEWSGQDNQPNIERLAPYKYLSEAQMNVVGLSLFLSGALTQTWSGLKTIMMDDPVQHFDDLNTYAFLDLIKSLMVYTPEEDRPQIILSTCDNRLLRLMKQKFAPLEDSGKVKYYVFKSVGVDGPVIE